MVSKRIISRGRHFDSRIEVRYLGEQDPDFGFVSMMLEGKWMNGKPGRHRALRAGMLK